MDLMSSEIYQEQQVRLTFEELSNVLEEYKEETLPYLTAIDINKVHDIPGYTTIIGQELANWKSKHPRIDDEIVNQEKAVRDQA